jgi:hypothetical protein
MAIVGAAVDGTVTAYRRDALITEAALPQMRAVYLGDLKRRTERLFVAAFHQALDDGAADEILDSLRAQFDAASEAIAKAKALGINAESEVEHILATAEPGLIEAWQQLDGHLAIINSIGAIASQFGCRTARFPLIEEYALAESFHLAASDHEHNPSTG